MQLRTQAYLSKLGSHIFSTRLAQMKSKGGAKTGNQGQGGKLVLPILETMAGPVGGDNGAQITEQKYQNRKEYRAILPIKEKLEGSQKEGSGTKSQTMQCSPRA